MQEKTYISAVVIGAGNRGKDVYGQYALNHPEELEIVAVAEPHPKRREQFAQAHNIPTSRQFKTWEGVLRQCIEAFFD